MCKIGGIYNTVAVINQKIDLLKKQIAQLFKITVLCMVQQNKVELLYLSVERLLS